MEYQPSISKTLGKTVQKYEVSLRHLKKNPTELEVYQFTLNLREKV